MGRSVFAAAAALLLIAPVSGLAQSATQPDASQVVVTTAPPAPPAASPASQVDQTDDAASDPNPVADQDAPKRHRISGEISVGVGTGGYREVDGEATAPIGDTGQISVAVGGGQIGNGRR